MTGRGKGDDLGRPRRRTWQAVLLTLAMVGLLLEVVVHVILNAGFLSRSLSSADGGIVVDWRAAWMVVPGRVHLRDFQMDVQQVGATWRLEVEEARTWVAVGPLFRREFDLRGTHAEGVRFALRPTSKGLDALDLPLLPAPPLRPIVPAEPILGAAAPIPWQLRFSDAEVHGLQEAWIGPYRAIFHRARAQARGRFHSGRILEFADLTLEDAAGEVWRGTSFRGVRIVEGAAEGRLDARGDPQKQVPLDVLGGLDAQGAFELAVDDLGFLLRLVDPGVLPAERLKGGGGQARVVASIDGGILQPGSGLWAQGEDVRWDFSLGRLEGDFTLDAAIPQGSGDGAPRSHVDFEVRQPRLYTRGNAVLAEAPRLSIRGEALRGTRLGTPPETRWMGIAFPEPATLHLPALNAVTGGLVRILEGEARLDLSLTLGEAQEDRPQLLRLTSNQVVARIGQSRVQGKLKADLRKTPPALDPRTLRFGTLAMRLQGLSVDDVAGKRKVSDWNGELSLRGLTLETQPLSISARLTGHVENIAPAVHLLVENTSVPGILGRLLTAEDLTLSSRLWMTPRLVSVRELELRGEGLRVDGQLRMRAGADPEAVMLVKMGILTGGVGLGRSGLEVHLFRPYRWFRNELSQQRSGRR